jgi:hypothetical protein
VGEVKNSAAHESSVGRPTGGPCHPNGDNFNVGEVKNSAAHESSVGRPAGVLGHSIIDVGEVKRPLKKASVVIWNAPRTDVFVYKQTLTLELYFESGNIARCEPSSRRGPLLL